MVCIPAPSTPSAGATGYRAGHGGVKATPGGSGAGDKRPSPPSFLSKFSQIFACFLQIFANISLAVFCLFNELAREKSLYPP